MKQKRFALTVFLIQILGISSLALADAKASLHNASGEEIGQAIFKAGRKNVVMTINVKGLTSGEHGIHIHGVGKCDGPDFKSAGPHFNPGNKKHGLKSAQGHHAGDLPNLVVDSQGRGHLVAHLRGVTMKSKGDDSLFHSGGTAVVVHAKSDDEISEPAGNSGDRIACGVIVKS